MTPGRQLLCIVAAMASVAGCSDRESASPPAAEFLFAASDSTWWVESGPDRFSVRSAPILLTRTEDAFYEVFVTVDAAEYEDASLLSARIYAREVMQKDSTLLYHDPTVSREIELWKQAHPRESPLTPDEEAEADEPVTIIADDIEIIDVHGPYVTFAHAIDIDVAGREQHVHTRRRGVIDVRNGRRATLAAVFGDSGAVRAEAAGRQLLAQFKDSIRLASDERAQRAAEILDSFQFDAASFGITDIGRDPAVAFVSVGTDTDGSAIVLDLPPIAMAEPSWWNDVRTTLPEWSADSSALLWNRPQYQVRAALSPDASSLELTVRRAPDSVSRGLSVRAWPVATVALPAHQLIALDGSPLPSELRTALTRAFNRSAMQDPYGLQVGQAVRQPSHLAAAVSSVSGNSISIPSRATRVRGNTVRASRSSCCASRE